MKLLEEIRRLNSKKYGIFVKIKLFIFFCNLGLPAVVVLTWSTVLLKTIGIDDICWAGYFNWDTYWIIKAPILIALFVCIKYYFSYVELFVI